MPENPTDKPETVIESKEIDRAALEQISADITNASNDVQTLGRGDLIDVHSGNATYRFKAAGEYDRKGTRREGDDVRESGLLVWKIEDADSKFDRSNYIYIASGADVSGKNLRAQISLYQWNADSALVSESSCKGNKCSSTEGQLLQSKTNDLINGVLKPQLDQMKKEEAIRNAEKAAIEEAARLEKAAKRAEEAAAKNPVNKVKNF